MPVAILLTLVISVPGLVVSRIQGVCWFANATEGYKLLIAWWASGYIWMVASMIYSIAVVVSVSRVLKKHQRQMSHEVSNGSGYSKRIQRSVFRISMYPVIPVITFTFSIIGSSLEFIRVGSEIESVAYGIVSISCILISDFTASATGILTAVVFCFDPMLQRFINSIRASSVSYYHSYSKTNSSTKSFKCHVIYWCLKKDIEQSLKSGEFSISYHGKSAVDEFPETHIMLSSIELMNQEGTEIHPSKHAEFNKKIQFL
ncbi:hypothetical protein K7432_010791 [Basidiobolus ranarum]|uniref:G-protein coupled receptors family 2 profile 2 domain-containing protein n=1 Tax=Basidiobolus ranarum TaxID=34480 RepID=A0ABR2WND0_9FUNG